MDSQLNIVKNMDDFLLYGRNLKEELKVEDEVGSQVEFGGSVLTAEKVKNEELIFIAPKGKRMKAFEELRKPQNKHDCQVFSGMLSSLSKWNPTVALEIPLIRKATAAKGRFVWTDAMEQEYNTVRKIMLAQIK